jgi:hypothetical protein
MVDVIGPVWDFTGMTVTPKPRARGRWRLPPACHGRGVNLPHQEPVKSARGSIVLDLFE